MYMCGMGRTDSKAVPVKKPVTVANTAQSVPESGCGDQMLRASVSVSEGGAGSGLRVQARWLSQSQYLLSWIHQASSQGLHQLWGCSLGLKSNLSGGGPSERGGCVTARL